MSRDIAGVSKLRDAVQYIRVSSDEQSKGGSLGAQTREGGEYIQKRSFRLLKSFQDVETAKSSGREDFGNLLAFLKKQKTPVALVVEKTDRLYRNHEDMVAVKALVKKSGHEVHLYKEDVILNAETPSHIWLMHYFKVAMSTNYVENLSEEIKKGQKQKILEGGWSWRAPYGYQMIKGELHVDPERAAFVRRAYELYATGSYSLEACAKALLDEGMLYRPNRPKITRSGLEKIFGCPMYYGKIQVNGAVYDGKHEPIISFSQWHHVQQALKKGKGKPMTINAQDFLYKGLLTCGECGKPLVGELKKQGRYTYYRCSALKNGCEQGYINEDIINKEFLSVMEALRFSDEAEQALLKTAKELHDNMVVTSNEETQKVDTEIKKTKNYIRQAYQDKLDGVIDEALWADMNNKYQEQLELLRDKQRRVDNADRSFYDLAEEFTKLPKLLNTEWLEANFDERKKLLNLLTSNFSVKDGKARIELKDPLCYIQQWGSDKTKWSIGDSNS